MAKSLDFQLDKFSNEESSDEESQSPQRTRISTLIETPQPSTSDTLHFDPLKQYIDNADKKQPSQSNLIEMLELLKINDSFKTTEESENLVISNLLAHINTLSEYINLLLQMLEREFRQAQNKKSDYKSFEASLKCESKQPSKSNIMLNLFKALKISFEYNEKSHKLLKSIYVTKINSLKNNINVLLHKLEHEIRQVENNTDKLFESISKCKSHLSESDITVKFKHVKNDDVSKSDEESQQRLISSKPKTILKSTSQPSSNSQHLEYSQQFIPEHNAKSDNKRTNMKWDIKMDEMEI